MTLMFVIDKQIEVFLKQKLRHAKESKRKRKPLIKNLKKKTLDITVESRDYTISLGKSI